MQNFLRLVLNLLITAVKLVWHHCHRSWVAGSSVQWTDAKVNNHSLSALINNIVKEHLFVLSAWSNHYTKSACKCGQKQPWWRRAKRARGRPMVSPFRDLCLCAQLSDLLPLLPLRCVAGDATKNRTEPDGTERPLSQKVTSVCCFLDILETLRTIRPLRKCLLHIARQGIYKYIYDHTEVTTT